MSVAGLTTAPQYRVHVRGRVYRCTAVPCTCPWQGLPLYRSTVYMSMAGITTAPEYRVHVRGRVYHCTAVPCTCPWQGLPLHRSTAYMSVAGFTTAPQYSAHVRGKFIPPTCSTRDRGKVYHQATVE